MPDCRAPAENISLCRTAGPLPKLFQLIKANLLVDLTKGLVGNVGGLLRSLSVYGIEITLVRDQALCFLADRSEGIYHCLTDSGLEDAIAPAFKLLLDLLERLAGDRGIDVHEVGNPGFILPVIAHAVLRVGVRDSALELFHDHIGLIHEEYTSLRDGLGHFLLGSRQTVDTGAHLADEGFGDTENIPVDVVEAVCYVSTEFNMLLLILSDRHIVGLIQENIGSHQRGICKKARIDEWMTTKPIEEIKWSVRMNRIKAFLQKHFDKIIQKR